MTPKNIIKIIETIRGTTDENLVVESAAHAEPLANVIFETKVLYDLLLSEADLDSVVAQISLKNSAAREYEKITGIKWPI
tara:strand:- start:381 stop:620 length:240 start_codon:yes stop_codon:yes gene_type:complete